MTDIQKVLGEYPLPNFLLTLRLQGELTARDYVALHKMQWFCSPPRKTLDGIGWVLVAGRIIETREEFIRLITNIRAEFFLALQDAKVNITLEDLLLVPLVVSNIPSGMVWDTREADSRVTEAGNCFQLLSDIICASLLSPKGLELFVETRDIHPNQLRETENAEVFRKLCDAEFGRKGGRWHKAIEELNSRRDDPRAEGFGLEAAGISLPTLTIVGKSPKEAFWSINDHCKNLCLY